MWLSRSAPPLWIILKLPICFYMLFTTNKAQHKPGWGSKQAYELRTGYLINQWPRPLCLGPALPSRKHQTCGVWVKKRGKKPNPVPPAPHTGMGNRLRTHLPDLQKEAKTKQWNWAYRIEEEDSLSKGPMAMLVGYTVIYFSLDCKYVKRIKWYSPSLATAFKVIVLVNISFRK